MRQSGSVVFTILVCGVYVVMWVCDVYVVLQVCGVYVVVWFVVFML